MKYYIANNATGTITQAIPDAVTTTIYIDTPGNFPLQPSFDIRIDYELMLVTYINPLNVSEWTVSRGTQGTTAVAHANGTLVTNPITAGFLNSLQSPIAPFIITQPSVSETNFQEWHDSTGAILGSISSLGTITVPSITVNGAAPATANYGVANFGSGPFDGVSAGHFQGSANGTGLAINMPTGFTGNIIDAQGPNGGAFAVDTYGGIHIGAITQFAADSNNLYGTTFNGYGANMVPIIAKGGSGNATDLQQWQNGAGAILSKIAYDGSYHGPRMTITPAAGNQAIQIVDATVGATLPNKFLRVNAGLLQVANSANNTFILNLDDTGNLIAQGTISSPISGPASYKLDTALSQGRLSLYNSGNSTHIELWASGAGGASLGIGQIGSFALYQLSQSAAYTHSFYGSAVGSVTTLVQGVASQTANLQEWQLSTGSVQASIDINGNITANQANISRIATNSGTHNDIYTYAANTYGLNVSTGAASTVPLVVSTNQAAQTADLQQWQDSTGRVLASMSNTGGLDLNSQNVRSGGLASSYNSYGFGYQTQWLASSQNQTHNILNIFNNTNTALSNIGATGITSIFGNLNGVAGPAAPTLNTNAATGGTLAAGNWGYAYTYIDANGLESYKSATLTVATTGTTSAVTINITAGTAGTTNIYRTALNGSILYYLTNIAYTSTTFQDTGSITLSSLRHNIDSTQGLVNIGSGPFDGISTGTFAGNAKGTGLAINMPSGYTGSFIDIAKGGVTYARLDASGSDGATLHLANPGSSQAYDIWTANGASPLAIGVVGAYFLAQFSNSGPALILTPQVQKISLVTRGDTGGATDIQQWQNNAGTILARFDATGDLFVQQNAIPATANYGALNVGPGPWDGTSAGHFAGNANGTGIAANFPSGYGGEIMDLQIAGSYMFRIDSSGNIWSPGQLLVPGIRGSGATGTLAVVNGAGANYPALSVSGTPGITNDIQQWSIDQSGTTLALAIDAHARIRAPGSTAPTIANGADGTSATLDTSPACSDQRGGITVSSTGTAGALCTVTFNAAWGSAPFINLAPRNAASVGTLYYTSTTTGFTAYTTLLSAQALSFSYVCMG